MYGKLDENGKFVPAQAHRPATAEELVADGNKEVYTASGSGKPGPGKKPVATYEDKGDFILKRVNWVDAG